MTAQPTTWSYLVRFVAEDDLTYFGDAAVPQGASGIHDTENLEARIITGNPFSGGYSIAEKTTPIKQLLGPLTANVVPDIRCIGGNYASHLKEIGMPFPKVPPMFPKSTNALAGHGDTIEIPTIAQDNQADYEGELVIVMGENAKNVSAADALDYVAGYSVANDVSARKWMMDPALVGTVPPPQMSFAKSFDGFCPVGPCIVSSKVSIACFVSGPFHGQKLLSNLKTLRDPHTLSLTTKVNDEVRQTGSTSDFVFDVGQIIEFCSQGSTLYAGSIILTGTPGGVGFAMKPPRFLQPGDRVDITIEGIGTLHHGIKFA